MNILGRKGVLMGEQEKLDIIRVIREELTQFKDYLEVKYSTKADLNQAKENRDNFCIVREKKLDDKFTPVYGMLTIIILFLASVHGVAFINFIIGRI